MSYKAKFFDVTFIALFSSVALLSSVALFNPVALPAAHAAQNWVMTSRYEHVANSETDRSVVEFTQSGKTLTYKPESMPYGMISNEKIAVFTKTYFLTGWSKGARTVEFKIFDPDQNGEKPVCEVTSFSETSALRQRNGHLEIKVSVLTDEDSGDTKSKWITCGK